MLCGSEEDTEVPTLNQAVDQSTKEYYKSKEEISPQNIESVTAYTTSNFFDSTPSQTPELVSFTRSSKRIESVASETSISDSTSPQDVFAFRTEAIDSDDDITEKKSIEEVEFDPTRSLSTEDDFIDLGMLAPPHPRLTAADAEF